MRTGNFRVPICMKDLGVWLPAVVKAGAGIIHLTPPVYDEYKGVSIGYAAVLDRYAGWLLEQRDSLGWKVVDIHFAMQQYLVERRQVDTAFVFARDGVHPDSLACVLSDLPGGQ